VSELRLHPSPWSQAAIDQAIAKLPEGKSGAIVLYADADSESMRFGVVAKVGDDWTFAGNLEREWDGPWSARGEVKFAWLLLWCLCLTT